MSASIEKRDISDLDFTGPPAAFPCLEHVGVSLVSGRRLGRLTRCRNSLPGRGCQRVVFGIFDVGQVGVNNASGIAMRPTLSTLEPDGLITKPFDQPERVGDEQDRFAAPPEVGELVEALVGEGLVADLPALVDEEDVGIDVDRRRQTPNACTCRTSRFLPAR
jgi:hypothetical protein